MSHPANETNAQRNLYTRDDRRERLLLAEIYRRGAFSTHSAYAAFPGDPERGNTFLLFGTSRAWFEIESEVIDNGNQAILPHYNSQGPIVAKHSHPRCWACGLFDAIVKQLETKELEMVCEQCGHVARPDHWEAKAQEWRPGKDHFENAIADLKPYRPIKGQVANIRSLSKFAHVIEERIDLVKKAQAALPPKPTFKQSALFSVEKK